MFVPSPGEGSRSGGPTSGRWCSQSETQLFHISHPLFCEDIRTCFLLPLPVELLDQKADGDEQSKEGKAKLYSSQQINRY